MAKPRSNADCARRWAQSMLEDDSPNAIEVNSVSIRTDRRPHERDGARNVTKWRLHTSCRSFGWYPMGVYVRDEDMKVVRVILNTDRHPSRGWASTPTDQGNVEREAKDAVRELNSRRRIRDRVVIERLPLTDSHTGPFQVVPRDEDPEPPARSYLEIPLVFHASDPGPEPVKDPHGCIAGRVEVFEATAGGYLTSEDRAVIDDQAYADVSASLYSPQHPGAETFWHCYGNGSRALYYRHAEMHTNVWGEARDVYRAPEAEPFKLDGYYSGLQSGVTYKQCPHCAAFDAVHERWHVQMHGLRWGRGRGRGWKVYSEMIARYGDAEAWRTARREDWRRVQRERKERAAWHERNHIPLSAISADRDGYPTLRADGYVLRKDAEAYFLKQRNEQRQEQRRRREAERRERESRQIERFKRRVNRRLDRSFERTAQRIAAELAALRTPNDSPEE